MLRPKTLDDISVQMRSSFNKMLEQSEKMELENAIVMFRDMVKADPEFLPARARLRELEIKNAENSDSKEALKSSLVFPIIIALKKIFAKKNILSMMENCEDALAVNVYNVSALTTLAELASAEEGYFIAVESLEIAASVKAKDKNMLKKLADAYLKNLQADKAVGIYQNYLRKNPKDTKMKQALKDAVAEMKLQESDVDRNYLDDAAKEKKELAEKKAKDLEAALLQQILEGTIRDANQAKLVISKLKPIVEKTNSIDMLRKLSEAYKVEQNYDEAIKCLSIVAKSLGTLDAKLDKDIEKLEVARINQQIQLIESNMDQYENSEEILAKLEEDVINLKISKAQNRSKQFINDIHLHYDLAMEYYNAGYLEEAYEEFAIAQKNMQHKGNSTYYMARIALVDSDVDKALPLLVTAQKNIGIKERNYKPATYYLGLVYENNGEDSKALEMFSKVYAIDPNYKDIAERVKK